MRAGGEQMLTGGRRGLELRRAGVDGATVSGSRARVALAEVGEVRHAVAAHALGVLQQHRERSLLPLLLLLLQLLQP